MNIPEQIIKAVDKTLSQEELTEFWNNPHPLLDGKSPKRLWEKGDRNRVLQFIESAKSGDMA